MGIKRRQQLILDYLEGKGACTYKELEELLKVSNMTVRRDIDRLALTENVIKTLGGAQKANAPASYYESSLLSRVSVHRDEKRTIAKKALEYIKTSESIYLGGGSTCLELAKLLAKTDRKLTVLTNSLLISHEAGQSSNNNILLVGGKFDPDTYCCAGSGSEKQVQDFFVDKAVISTKGFIPEEGTYESSIAISRIKQIVATRSNEVVLLVDHSKFDLRALFKVFDISQIDTVITDSIERQHLSVLEEAGLSVILTQQEVNEREVSNNAT